MALAVPTASETTKYDYQSGVADLSFAKPSGTATDDYLVLYCVKDDNVSNFNTPTGWTQAFQVADAGGDDATIALFYIKEASQTGNTTLSISGADSAQERSGILFTVSGADQTNFLDVAWSVGSHFSSQQDTSSPNPPAITTATDGAMVLVGTGNRNNSNTTEMTVSGTWDTVAPSGYVIESSTPTTNPAPNSEGAPGRIRSGGTAGDSSQTWAWKIVATAGTEDAAAFTGFSALASTYDKYRDHKVWVIAIRPAAAAGASGTASVTAVPTTSSSGAKGGKGTAAASTSASATSSGNTGRAGAAGVSTAATTSSVGVKGGVGSANVTTATNTTATGSKGGTGTATVSASTATSSAGSKGALGTAAVTTAATTSSSGTSSEGGEIMANTVYYGEGIDGVKVNAKGVGSTQANFDSSGYTEAEPSSDLLAAMQDQGGHSVDFEGTEEALTPGTVQTATTMSALVMRNGAGSTVLNVRDATAGGTVVVGPLTIAANRERVIVFPTALTFGTGVFIEVTSGALNATPGFLIP